jgi:hypothetical protein
MIAGIDSRWDVDVYLTEKEIEELSSGRVERMGICLFTSIS